MKQLAQFLKLIKKDIFKRRTLDTDSVSISSKKHVITTQSGRQVNPKETMFMAIYWVIIHLFIYLFIYDLFIIINLSPIHLSTHYIFLVYFSRIISHFVILLYMQVYFVW